MLDAEKTTRRRMGGRKVFQLAVLLLVLAALGWLLRSCRNTPWRSDWARESTYFTCFVSEMKTLDPAESYYTHEGEVLDSIVEMPLMYDYLKRPYELIPMLAETMPEMHVERDESGRVTRVEALITLKQGVLYQPHPCFANKDGRNPNAEISMRGIESTVDFPYQGTREMTAEDFKVALTRLCDARLASPVYSSLSSFILGMNECTRAIQAEVKLLEAEALDRDLNLHPVVVDYRRIPFRGIEILDKYRFKLVMTREYPQMRYWLAMHFFSPVPQECLDFYGVPAVADAGFTMKNWPVGTGAYYMTRSAHSEQIVLERNPNYRPVFYPSEGSEEDRKAGLLRDAGKRLPLIQRIVLNHEREMLPIWLKFCQGYYDSSGIPTDAFDSTVTVDMTGDMSVSDELAARGVRMAKAVQATTFYLGFNMLDKTLGGLSPERKKLRQAISIALDYQEYSNIFANGRDIPAQSMIPPNAGVAGASLWNPWTDERDEATGRVHRKSIDEARRLMAEAGYPSGIGPDGKPLRICYDMAGVGNSWKAEFQWMRKHLEPLGIELESRVTDGNRHRDKIEKGDWQMVMKGWIADYPDAENFLMLFYSPNGIVKQGGHGINYTNYESAAFDEQFRQLEAMPDSPERLALIERANAILQEDAPCVWALHPRSLSLLHRWFTGYKPHTMGKTFMQYRSIDGADRVRAQREWNRPMYWPMVLLLCLAGAVGVVGILRQKE